VDVISLLHPVSCEDALVWVGPKMDGGYIVPDILNTIQRCFSPGVNDQTGFKEEFISNGIMCHMADASVDDPKIESDLYTFDRKFIQPCDSIVSVEINSWIEKYVQEGEKDCLLQMDIEGAEYANLLALKPELLRRFKVICVEFHGLHEVFNRTRMDIFKQVFMKLGHDFHPIFLKPNNTAGAVKCLGLEIPRILEVTFYRKEEFVSIPEYLPNMEGFESFDNDGSAERIHLDEHWFRELS